MGTKTKASLYTMVISVANSVAVVIFNLIYNNCLIRVYGSEVNGLISTLTQFVSLFAIIEGGFTTAAVVATYDPIVKKDYSRLNDILYTTKKTYMRIGMLITLGVLIAGSIYIRFIESPFSYFETYLLLMLSVLTTASSLCFVSKYSVLLLGCNKEYIQVILSLVAKTITWIISILMILNNVNILLVYSINLVNILLNLLFLHRYEKSNFPFVNYKGKFDSDTIQGTGDVLLQKIANTVFTSTDLILISVFINLAMASVYNLYYQVFKSILTFLASVVQAPFNSFGQLVQTEEGKKKLDNYFGIYQHLTLVLSSIVLTITGALIIPFVKVYTIHISDCEYVYPSLAVLFYSQIFAQIINRPYGTILNATGNFKMQNKQCIAAAITNIIVSLAFIKIWGVNSIIFGSFVGTIIIVVANIVQVYKYIIKSGIVRSVSNIIINYVVGLLLIYAALSVQINPGSYLQWILVAIVMSFISLIIFLLINLVIDKKNTLGVWKYIKDIWVKKKKNT